MSSTCNHQLPATLEKSWTFAEPESFYKIRGLSKVSDLFSFPFDENKKFWFRIETNGTFSTAKILLEGNGKSVCWPYMLEKLVATVINPKQDEPVETSQSKENVACSYPAYEIHCRIVYTLDGCPYCDDERKKKNCKL
ncbi:hypothetical protein M3Y94_00025900 [Aphelenchoides besseyi]|nr:hypothetical protein M3Y94_00025900 [Aphelenchoides besseyi]